mmetsp:Transcript_26597/g.100083  ORF Transcript_26597/g.100083 Transcript_26597/m.100083 type:complete len:208 (+) Transcript_26597:1907-2530(+)
MGAAGQRGGGGRPSLSPPPRAVSRCLTGGFACFTKRAAQRRWRAPFACRLHGMQRAAAAGHRQCSRWPPAAEAGPRRSSTPQGCAGERNTRDTRWTGHGAGAGGRGRLTRRRQCRLPRRGRRRGRRRGGPCPRHRGQHHRQGSSAGGRSRRRRPPHRARPLPSRRGRERRWRPRLCQLLGRGGRRPGTRSREPCTAAQRTPCARAKR